jgi:transcriptional regulator with XRE-family HTH domain
VSSAKQFGEILRRHREQRGISLKAVADETKIGAGFLTALERGDCAKWPGGIYSRAWIRAYASAIGLDPEDVGARFARCFATPGNADAESAATPAVELSRKPLRMTLEPDPAEWVHLITRRVLLFAADLVMVLLTATAVSALTVATFWNVFAIAAVVCHGIGLFGGGGSAAGLIDRLVRRHARPHESAGDPAVAEA